MNKFLITYDLKNADKNSYTALYEAIKAISTWWHYLDSTWIVKSDSLSADQIYKLLAPHINKDSGDYILVIKIDTSNKQGWLPQGAWDWLNS